MACKYCTWPYKVFDSGDKLVPPRYKGDWWGIMAHYRPGKIGTIIKTEECPNCGRKLE